MLNIKNSVHISIVVYKHTIAQMEQLLQELVSCGLKLSIIDNFDSQGIAEFCQKNSITYVKNTKNIGYGSAHNLAMRKSIEEGTPYHLVLNPDISFKNIEVELNKIFSFMDENPKTALLMPKILNPDGTLQPLAKLLPSPFVVFLRRFVQLKSVLNKINSKYELRFTEYKQVMNVPYLSGCFMLFRTSALKEVGLFDERFFMYFEDTDITRRLHRNWKTVMMPHAEVIHGYNQESYRSIKLFYYHILSGIKYFNKYGWFLDKEKAKMNHSTLNAII